MKNRPKLGVAVVGLGIVGSQLARAFQAHEDCSIRWYYDIDEERSITIRDEIREGQITRDYETILNSHNTQIVVIASYDDAHFDQVNKALQAGKHVFVEKPMCQALNQLKEIKETREKYGNRSKLYSNLVLRAAPLYKWLREQIKSGEFGEIYAIDGDYLYGRLSKIVDGWRGQIETYSAIQGGGIHLIDLMLWLTGDRPIRVFACANQISTKGTGFRHPDFVAVTTMAESGLVGRITANLGCVHRHQHVLRIFGTRATFIYDDTGPRVHFTRDPATVASPVVLAPLPSTKGDLIPDFVSTIINSESREADTQAIFDGISISVAAEKSLRSGNLEEIVYV